MFDRIVAAGLAAFFAFSVSGLVSGPSHAQGFPNKPITIVLSYAAGGPTDFLARSFTWQWPGLAAARGLGLTALQVLPPVRAALARHMMFGWR